MVAGGAAGSSQEASDAEGTSADEALPGWFQTNIDAPRASNFVSVQGCSIHYLAWSCRANHTDSRRSGLIFLHGNGAHAHWFTFLAPFYTKDYDVVSLSNSGNGESGWREAYSLDIWADEVIAVASDAGFLDTEVTRAKPIVVAHSMGVVIAMALARKYSASLGGLILLDELPRPPGYFDGLPALKDDATSHKIHTDPPRTRMRLAPPQQEMNRFILNFVADHSIRKVPDGWVWLFDPAKSQKTKDADRFPYLLTEYLSVEAVRALRIKATFIVGQRSAICSPDIVEFNRHALGDHFPIVELRDAAHHVMMDQPLSLVAAIDATLGEWKRTQLTTLSGDVLPRSEQRVLQSSFDVSREAPSWKTGSMPFIRRLKDPDQQMKARL